MAEQDWLDQDFYKILGVDKSADDKEIRKAYRKLARKWHPDQNAGDTKAEAKFKEIGEAFAVLSDKDQRERYDAIRAMGSGGPRYTGGGAGGGFEDMFGGMFGGGAGQGGPNVRYQTSGGGGGGFGGAEDILSSLFGGGGGSSPFGSGGIPPATDSTPSGIRFSRKSRSHVRRRSSSTASFSRHSLRSQLPPAIL